MAKKTSGRLVYSTDPFAAKRCPECGHFPCVCPPPVYPPPEKQIARLSRQKRAKGKEVTVVASLQLSPEDLADLTKSLKKLCGAGGSAKDGDIEIQGDHRDKVEAKLQSLGYRVKRVGG